MIKPRQISKSWDDIEFWGFIQNALYNYNITYIMRCTDDFFDNRFRIRFKGAGYNDESTERQVTFHGSSRLISNL